MRDTDIDGAIRTVVRPPVERLEQFIALHNLTGMTRKKQEKVMQNLVASDDVIEVTY
jgi:hypothetical protein